MIRRVPRGVMRLSEGGYVARWRSHAEREDALDAEQIREQDERMALIAAGAHFGERFDTVRDLEEATGLELGGQPITVTRMEELLGTELRVRHRQPRGRPKGKSRKSQQRQRQKLGSIAWDYVPDFMVLGFLTLTVSGAEKWTTEQGWADARHALRKLYRRFLRWTNGRGWGQWVLEPQKRGAPHYHLVIAIPDDLLPDADLTIEHFQSLFLRHWRQCTGDFGITQVDLQPLASGQAASSYLTKYIAKESEGYMPPGFRCWGGWNEKLIPVQCEDVVLWEDEYIWVQRLGRRFVESQQRRRGKRPRGQRGKSMPLGGSMFVRDSYTQRKALAWVVAHCGSRTRPERGGGRAGERRRRATQRDAEGRRRAPPRMWTAGDFVALSQPDR